MKIAALATAALLIAISNAALAQAGGGSGAGGSDSGSGLSWSVGASPSGGAASYAAGRSFTHRDFVSQYSSGRAFYSRYRHLHARYIWHVDATDAHPAYAFYYRR